MWRYFMNSMQLKDKLRNISKEKNVDFNTLPKIQAMNPNAPMETMRAMAEDALISATVTGQLKLSISSVGYGIINAGAGVTAFTGSPTSVYVEPNWFI